MLSLKTEKMQLKYKYSIKISKMCKVKVKQNKNNLCIKMSLRGQFYQVSHSVFLEDSVWEVECSRGDSVALPDIHALFDDSFPSLLVTAIPQHEHEARASILAVHDDVPKATNQDRLLAREDEKQES